MISHLIVRLLLHCVCIGGLGYSIPCLQIAKVFQLKICHHVDKVVLLVKGLSTFEYLDLDYGFVYQG